MSSDLFVHISAFLYLKMIVLNKSQLQEKKVLYNAAESGVKLDHYSVLLTTSTSISRKVK